MNRLRYQGAGSALLRLRSCNVRVRALSSFPQSTTPEPTIPTPFVSPISTDNLSEPKRSYTPDPWIKLRRFKFIPLVTGSEMYEGATVEGKRTGIGKLIWSDGTVYEGYFADDKMHGKGKLTKPDRSMFVGRWVAGRQDGKGTFTDPEGRTIKGRFLDGVIRNGNGSQFMPTNKGVFEGKWWNFERNGRGKIIYEGRVTFDGMFRYGRKFNGHGYYTKDGVTMECTYVDGVMCLPEQKLNSTLGTEQTAGYAAACTPALSTSASTVTTPPSSVLVQAGKVSNTKAERSDAKSAKVVSTAATVAAVASTGPDEPAAIVKVENGCTGQGVLVMDNGHVYSGTWLNGSMVGPGKVELTCRPSIHKGTASLVEKTNSSVKTAGKGQGVLVMDNGHVYSGTWLNGSMVGPGKVELTCRPSLIEKHTSSAKTCRKPLEQTVSKLVKTSSGDDS